ncbi:hypothetical protein BC939DRAFT_454204 [Gamsiella multidivaricata]|uniref:uncharacterized protein n=1 Tax=Gamsiella multidivaricata TaxID=101098 RepID=UPI002220AFBB|nr:uncharacterized protein BC939DRAFT_454204 [Gamsiella multidivaricata]KAI7822178.1 hypothetical protein BC939DRAFT_454204 [Gamsiella multidivaricata]
MPSSHSIKTLLKGHASSEQVPDSKTSSAPAPASALAPVDHRVNEAHAKDKTLSNAAKSQGTQLETQVQEKGVQDKASDFILSTPGSRKRSILLNMMLPPEAPPVDANLALPPVLLFPPMIEPQYNATTILEREISADTAVATPENTTESTSTARSLRSWVRGSNNDGRITKRNNHAVPVKRGSDDPGVKCKEGIIMDVNIVHSETTTVMSKSSHVRTWISKIARTVSENRDGGETGNEKKQAVIGGASTTNVSTMQGQEQQQTISLPASTSSSVLSAPVKSLSGGTEGTITTTTTTTVQQQEIVHQEIHQKTRSVALVNVNVSIQDVFGLGKILEMVLALSHAHGAFLRRQPFWLQCVIMGWEGILVMLLVWGLLRIVGLAEVVVWGADDLVRGTLSTVQTVGRVLATYFSH